MVIVYGQRIGLLTIEVVGDTLAESVNAVINAIDGVIDTPHKKIIGMCTFKTCPLLVLNQFL